MIISNNEKTVWIGLKQHYTKPKFTDYVDKELKAATGNGLEGRCYTISMDCTCQLKENIWVLELAV